MHNWPGMPQGEFAIRPGPFFAASDWFDVEIEGRGGHAAKPHDTVDPVVLASQMITAFQSIVSRNADPIQQMVISVTSVSTSSDAYNVIPQSAHMHGTVRTMSAEMRDLAEARMQALCDALASGYGARITFNYTRSYPVMANHADQTDFAAEVARGVTGQCDDAPLVMGGEDFAFMLEERPGAYILLGNGDTAMVHSPDYNFDDDVIPTGCSWFAEIAERRMPAG